MTKNFFRAWTALCLIAFAAWLMPLGAFIKPSQEKIACGGNRAMHMCSMNDPAEVRTDPSDKVSYSNAGHEGVHKGSASSGAEFLAPEMLRVIRKGSVLPRSSETFTTYHFFKNPPEYPPIVI